MKISKLFILLISIMIVSTPGMADNTRIRCLGGVPEVTEDDQNVLVYPSEMMDYLNLGIINMGKVTGNPQNDMMEGSTWTFSNASSGVIIGNEEGDKGLGIFFALGAQDSFLVDVEFKPENKMMEDPFFAGLTNRMDIYAGMDMTRSISLGLRMYYGFVSELLNDMDERGQGYHETLFKENKVTVGGGGVGITVKPSDNLDMDLVGGIEKWGNTATVEQFNANYKFPDLFIDTSWVSIDQQTSSDAELGYNLAGRVRYSYNEDTDLYFFCDMNGRTLPTELNQLNENYHFDVIDTLVTRDTTVVDSTRSREYKRFRIGTGTNLHVGNGGLLIMGAYFDWLNIEDNRYRVDENFGEQLVNGYNLKYDAGLTLFGGMEIPVFSILKMRAGIEKRFYNVVDSESDGYVYSQDDGTLEQWNKNTEEARVHPLKLSFGAGLDYKNLTLDVAMNRRFFYTGGMVSFSGDTPLLEISAEYRF